MINLYFGVFVGTVFGIWLALVFDLWRTARELKEHLQKAASCAASGKSNEKVCGVRHQ